jgi:opacity protein-like surface antigen
MAPPSKVVPWFPVVAALGLALASGGCSAPSLQATEETPNLRPSLDLMYGQAEYTSDDLEGSGDLEEPDAYGLQFSHPLGGGPLAIDFGLAYLTSDEDLGSFDVLGIPFDDVEFTLSQYEVNLGLSLQFAFGDPDVLQFVPYIGGGGLFAVGVVELDGTVDFGGGPESFSEEEEETSAGYYGRAGVAIPIAEAIRIGAEYRLVGGVDFDGVEAENDRILFFLGFDF